MVRLSTTNEDPLVASLTAQAGDDIIEVDRDGNLVVRLLCEDCLDAAYREDESEIDFIREPWLH